MSMFGDTTPPVRWEPDWSQVPCPGPLIWYDVAGSPPAAILECYACRYLVVTGTLHDDRHAATPIMREGLSA